MIQTCIFIDAANIAHTQRQLDNARVDYNFLRMYVQGRTQQRAICKYFTAIIEGDDGVIQNKKLIDWLAHNGYQIFSKQARVFKRESGNVTKGNMDVEIAVEWMKAIQTRAFNCFVLVSGDGDFVELVKQAQAAGIYTVIMSAVGISCSEELRKQADLFIDTREFLRMQEDYEKHNLEEMQEKGNA